MDIWRILLIRDLLVNSKKRSLKKTRAVYPTGQLRKIESALREARTMG